MLFNSLIFPVFFVVVYAAYLLVSRSYRAQNVLLLVASYVFYGWWDWRFCGLLLLSTVVDFAVARAMDRSDNEGRRRALLTLSVAVNLGVLGFFKYFDFFFESVEAGLQTLGLNPPDLALRIILPVGISFYTFQTMSYTIDVYRRKMGACSDIFAFGLYVAFFPQLVAGPIERASHLLPQMTRPRQIRSSDIDLGLWLVLWGMFKKVVIADNLAVVANDVFNNYPEHGGINIAIGALAFTGQIYCDFSGYSDIARGIARMMGFDIMLNFRLPYFALNPSDFWRRWHISLSSWLRDYLYIPLGGNKRGTLFTYRNLMITMLLGGLWHGAAWNFVVWGLFHGLLLIAYRPFTPNTGDASPDMSGMRWIRVLFQWAVMFFFTVIGWIIFRAESAQQIVGMIGSFGLGMNGDTLRLGTILVGYGTPLLVMQLVQHFTRDLAWPVALPALPRGVFYGGLLTAMAIWGAREPVEFIYFQF